MFRTTIGGDHLVRNSCFISPKDLLDLEHQIARGQNSQEHVQDEWYRTACVFAFWYF